MKPSIRTKYPLTATDAGIGRGTVREVRLAMAPPDYVSAGKRVERWSMAAREVLSAPLWYIRGHGVGGVRKLPLTPRTPRAFIRAAGTCAEMQAVLEAVVREWAQLPYGREVETVMERDFPRVLTLEVTPTVDLTLTKKSRKKKSEQPTPQQN